MAGFDITRFDTEPHFEIGTQFIDCLGQHWQYCGIVTGVDLPVFYRWIPTAWYNWIQTETEPKMLTVSL